MYHTEVLKRIRSAARNTSGNFAIWSALSMIPLAVAAGTAVDYSQLSNRRYELQSALDTAVLAVAREGKTISDDQALQIARDYLASNVSLDVKKLVLTRRDGEISLSGSIEQKLNFGGVLGYDKLEVTAESTANIAYTKYEISLVLDTTGSMAGGKLSSLKGAVIGLVNTMVDQIEDTENLKFAVVPFANFVNVGPHHAPLIDNKGKVVKKTGAEWLDVKGSVDLPQLELKKGISRFEVFYKLGEPWTGCVETRYSGGKKAKPYDVSDLPADPKQKNSLFVPAFSIDEPDVGYGNSYIASDADPLDKSLTGEIKKLVKYGVDPLEAGLSLLGTGDDDDDDDDDDGDDRNSVTGSGGAASPTQPNLVPGASAGGKGPNKDCVTQPLMPLGNDYLAIKKMVNGLQANGTTNITEGVAWGMRVLSPREPFSEGRAKAPGVEKIMIVLTDGANVFGNNGTKLGSTYSSNGYLVDGRLGVTVASAGSTGDLMNKKTLAACANAKKDGMIIYTIRLEEPDKATGTMLQECATSPAHFFDAPSRGQLDSVFQEIGKTIVKLRLSS